MYYYPNVYNVATIPYRYYSEDYSQPYAQYSQGEERFFGFGILPFIAGLAIAPLLFNNRPCYPPYPPPYAFPPPYAYPPNIPPQAYNPMYGSANDTINIYTK